MRIAVVTASIASVLAILAACDSFDEGETTTPPDAAPSDTSIADGPNESDASDAARGPFCDSYRDSSAFCFDFDTEELAPKWTITTVGNGSATAFEGPNVSPPRALVATLDQLDPDAGPAVGAIGRTILADVASATIDFDVAVETLSSSTSFVFVRLEDGASNFNCGFGINADPQLGATLVTTSPSDGGTAIAVKSNVDVFPASGFAHVTLRWTSTPRQVSGTIGGKDIGTIDAPGCGLSKQAAIAFGLQISRSPVQTRVRIDNIVYAFAP